MVIAQGDFVSLPLRGTTPEPHFGRGIDVKFVTSIGENDGTDVPSFHHQMIPTRKLMQFLSDNLPDEGQPADARKVFVHTVITQMVGGINVIDQNARFVVLNAARNRCRFESLADTIDIFCSNSLFENMPSDRAVDSAGVNVHNAKPAGELARNTAFSRGSRAIDCDYLIKIWLNRMHRAKGLDFSR